MKLGTKVGNINLHRSVNNSGKDGYKERTDDDDGDDDDEISESADEITYFLEEEGEEDDDDCEVLGLTRQQQSSRLYDVTPRENKSVYLMEEENHQVWTPILEASK